MHSIQGVSYDLEGKVLIFNRTGADVKPDDIEACHRLYSIKKAIVKFSERKLKNTNPSEIDFTEGTAIFMNTILCSYYKM